MAATHTATQAIVPARQKIANLRSMLESSKDQIAAALPQHLTPERMIRVVMTAIQRTPKLMECSPGSIIGSVIVASQLGLEPDGVLGRGFLIPRKNRKTNQMEANFMPGYLGLIDLAMRSGKVSWIASELVFKSDKFKVTFGVDRNLIHEPDMDNPDRGIFDEKDCDLVDLRGAYAVVRYKDGSSDFEYMPLAKLHQLRNFSQSKDSEYSPWNTAMGIEDMYRKCPIRKLAKRCPLTAEFQKAAQLVELVESGFGQDMGAEIDSASEAADLATQNRTDAIREKYAKPAGDKKADAVPVEDVSPPVGTDPYKFDPTEKAVVVVRKLIKAANETGKIQRGSRGHGEIRIYPETSADNQNKNSAALLAEQEHDLPDGNSTEDEGQFTFAD